MLSVGSERVREGVLPVPEPVRVASMERLADAERDTSNVCVAVTELLNVCCTDKVPENVVDRITVSVGVGD